MSRVIVTSILRPELDPDTAFELDVASVSMLFQPRANLGDLEIVVWLRTLFNAHCDVSAYFTKASGGRMSASAASMHLSQIKACLPSTIFETSSSDLPQKSQ